MLMVSKEEIKQAAFELFAEKGYECTSTQDIADAVGLKKQSLYSHFKSKSDIFVEVLQDQSAIILTELVDSFEADQDDAAEFFLKSVFDSLIRTFSVRKRLLFLKRTILLYANRNRYSFAEEFIRQFNATLQDSLHEILSRRYGLFKDPQRFILFYTYFMLHVSGCLEIILTDKADESFLQVVWSKLWAASEAFFAPELS